MTVAPDDQALSRDHMILSRKVVANGRQNLESNTN